MPAAATEPVIQVEGLHKVYRIWRDPTARLKAPIANAAGRYLPKATTPQWLRRRITHEGAESFYYRDFHALHNIHFRIQRGESVGIIGRNGSGKSTLLQILAGTLRATSGKARVQGRIAALLELGSGFNPEFTGIENLYLNATILGLTKKETDSKVDAILDFANIGDYVHEPVKTYSSGMMLRLAFAVQTVVEPHILIVDEALSVGDIFFQQKCATRMREMRQRGVTLLFVSHDPGIVRDLCERTLYLRQGQLRYDGPTTKALELYYNDRASPSGHAPTVERHTTASPPAPPIGDSLKTFVETAFWKNQAPADTPSLLALRTSVQPTTLRADINAEIGFEVLLDTRDCADSHLMFILKDRHGQIITSQGTYTRNQTIGTGLQIARLQMTLALEAGEYTFQLRLGRPTENNCGTTLDETPWLGPLTITHDYTEQKAPFFGKFGMPFSITLATLEDAHRPG